MYRVCLNCGNIEVRTDIMESLNTNYKIIRSISCPYCSKNNYLITKNIKRLKTNLNTSNKLERNIKNLIG